WRCTHTICEKSVPVIPLRQGSEYSPPTRSGSTPHWSCFVTAARTRLLRVRSCCCTSSRVQPRARRPSRKKSRRRSPSCGVRPRPCLPPDLARAVLNWSADLVCRLLLEKKKRADVVERCFGERRE